VPLWRLDADAAGTALLVRVSGVWSPPSTVALTATYDASAVPAAVAEAVSRITSRWIDPALSQEFATTAVVLQDELQVLRSWRDPDVVAMLKRHVVNLGR